MPQELRAELLGGLTLFWIDGEGQSLRALPNPPTAKSQSLLAYLLINRANAHPRERLMVMFWPDRPEQRARRSLSTALWHIRRCLPAAAVIQADGHTVQFTLPEPIWVDMERLEALAAHSDLASLEAARALYRGEVLEGLYDDWIVDERYRTQTVYHQVLSRLMTLYAEHSRHADALEAAQQLLHENPLREDAHRAAMLAHTRLGRRNAALEQFETLRRRLLEELGATPTAETAALRQAILDGHITPLEAPVPSRPPAATSRQASRSPAHGAPSGPLAGRAEELALLETAWAAARAGQGSLVLIHGEAGIGKTRLAEALADAARVSGGRVLWGRCFEFERMLPFQPVAEALRPELAGDKPHVWERLPGWAAASIGRLLPDLAPPALEEAANASSGIDPARLFEALALCLTAMAERWPALLVLDDLHWASDSTLQLLHYLARRLSSAPVLCLGTYRRFAGGRRHPLVAFANQVEHEQLGRLLALGRLPFAAVEQWVRQQSGLGDAARPLADWLFQETSGHPFFMVETVAALFETGRLKSADGVWVGDLERISADGSPLPDRIRNMVQERASRLDRDTQEALDLAAVLGREFDYEVFEAMWGKGPDAALGVLEALMRHGLVEEGRGESGRDYAFNHHKLQESLYQGIPRLRRHRLHTLAGAAMERQYATALDDAAPELAHHFDQARRLDNGLLPKAISYLQRAGEAAVARFANAEAAAYFGRALDLAAPSDTASRFALLSAREAVWQTLGDRSAQARDLEALETLALSLDDEARAEAALRRAAYDTVIGNYPGAISGGQAALRFAEAAQSAAQRVRAHYQWAMGCFHAGDFATAGAQFEAGRRLAETSSLPRLEADTLLGLSLVAWRQGRYAEVTAHALQARALYQQIGYMRGEGNVLQQLGIAARYQDQYPEARAYFEAGLALWRRIGERRGEGFALVNLGVVALDLSDFQAARQHFEQARQIWLEINHPDGENTVLGNLAAVALRQGDFHAAEDYARQALAICQRIGNRHGAGVNQYLLGYALAETGAFEEARPMVEAALRISRELEDRRYEAMAQDGLGRVALYQHDYAAAEDHFRQAAGLSQEMGERANECEFRLMLGLAAARRGAFDLARSQLELAQGLAAEVGDPLRLAALEAAWGEWAYRQEQPQRALEHGERALETASRLGARALEAEVLLVVGHAHAALSAWAEAQSAYASALALFEALRLDFRRSEAQAGLDRVAHSQRQP